MSDDFLFSSDTGRTAAPLRYSRTVLFDHPLTLELGGSLPQVTVVYETYGQLSAARDNAVLICHALSGDSHVARHDPQDDPGWWDIAVGPGKAIDTDKYFVICPNILGGCRGTTGPNSINPATGRPYGRDFPTITIGDMVEVQRRLVDHLEIDRLLAVTGGSMGGHQVLHWATKLPDRVRGAIPIATSARLSSQALAFDVVGRNAILRDTNFRNGQYYDDGPRPNVGLAIARMIGHITYLSREAMRQKFGANRLQPREVPVDFEKKFSVGSYLGYKGAEFVERFDANSYIAISMAMDLFDLGDNPEKLKASLKASRCRWLVLSFTSDWLFSPEESQQIVNALIASNKEVSYCNVGSSCGHDAFLLGDDLERYGELIRAFLAHVDGGAQMSELPVSVSLRNPTSIFHSERLDYDLMLDLIPPNTGVLDLGCGDGELLSRLKRRGHEFGAPAAEYRGGEPMVMGVELDEKAIIACVRRGLDVVQADLNKGLDAFADRQFDYVVLSQTLQAVRDVEGVVSDMLRVGRRCIVSFPNFAYYKLRQVLSEQGKAPETSGLLRYKWYNSPNIRFFSIADFEEFCAERAVTIHRRIALDTEAGKAVDENPNLYADLAIFVISR